MDHLLVINSFIFYLFTSLSSLDVSILFSKTVRSPDIGRAIPGRPGSESTSSMCERKLERPKQPDFPCLWPFIIQLLLMNKSVLQSRQVQLDPGSLCSPLWALSGCSTRSGPPLTLTSRPRRPTTTGLRSRSPQVATVLSDRGGAYFKTKLISSFWTFSVCIIFLGIRYSDYSNI